jgi:tetratricopeptide (TPR) repeat protein
MAIDTYAPCPGGTGKKIKFCCADLVGDLEQLDRLVEGDQISAALDQVRRLADKYPGRPCLMATRTKLELGSKQFAEAAVSSKAFLDAHPDNPLALGQAAVTDAVAGRVQEAAALFDKARLAALAAGRTEGGHDVSPELVRIAATLVQAGAQLGHVGFAQGIVEWLFDRGLGSDEERRLLAAIVGSAGVPPALRTKVRLTPTAADAAWRPEFDAALEHANQWRLSKALTSFRSLKGVAGESRELFTNIALVCEMLARPFEAAEAWLALAKLRDVPHDDAIEATGRAIALETEADPDRSPLVQFASVIAPLAVGGGEEGTTALELLEDKLRHDDSCETAPFDRSSWVSRGAVPPRSVWRVYEPASGGDQPACPPRRPRPHRRLRAARASSTRSWSGSRRPSGRGSSNAGPRRRSRNCSGRRPGRRWPMPRAPAASRRSSPRARPPRDAATSRTRGRPCGRG